MEEVLTRRFTHGMEELEEEGGIPARSRRYRENNRLLISEMKKLGYDTYVGSDVQGPIITTFLFPENAGYGFAEMYAYIKERGYAIYPGKVTEAETFRIGKIGEIYKEDIEKLEQLLAETYKAKEDGIHALSQAMFLFHRTIIFLSGNTITPLILNAFLVPGLSFWEDYILTVGEDASLERLEIFLNYIRNGRGKELADLQREWLEAYKRQKYMAD